MLMTEQPTLSKEALFRNLRREGTPERVFIFEHAIDEVVRAEIVERFSLVADVNPADPAFLMKRDLAIHRFVGLELLRVWLPGTKYSIYFDEWVTDQTAPIKQPEDIEKYEWPDIAKVDFSQLDWHEQNMPEDMGVVHTVHVFEIVRDLMGFETMCIALYERPEFVAEVCERAGSFALHLVEQLCQYECVAVIYGADDFGFKTSLLVDPDNLRRLFLPWHRRFAQIAHEHGKLYFLHSCGQIAELMDDIIEDIKADAKHSFEDVITPVTEAKRLWGDRISLLGGLDVDFMARADEPSIRRRVREVLDICMPGGGYCLGLGNWVTSYIPLDNYLVMLDEARRYS